MLSFGVGAPMQAGTCVTLSSSAGALCGNISWVQTQHIMPLPPHHRPRMLPAQAAAGSVSLQTFPEQAHSSPQVAVAMTRQSQLASPSHNLARQVTRGDFCSPGLGSSAVRKVQHAQAAARSPQTTADLTTEGHPGALAQTLLDNALAGETGPAVQGVGGPVVHGFRPAVSAAGDESSSDIAVGNNLLRGDQLHRRDRPPTGQAGHCTDGSLMAHGSATYRGPIGRISDSPSAMPGLQPPRTFDHSYRRHVAIPQGQPLNPQPCRDNQQHQQRHGQQQGRGQQRGQRHEHKAQENAVERGPAAPTSRIRTPGLTPSHEKVDKALLVAILRCASWRNIRELLHNHQQQCMEASRLAAAAAVAASTEAIQDADISSRHGPAVLREREQRLEAEAASVSGASGHFQQQQQPRAFTPRHLATALHVTSLRVLNPCALSHADRVQLGEFLEALGRGCASLVTREPFPPVDLTMALRALAKLLGKPTSSSPQDAATAARPGGRFGTESYGGSCGDVASEECADGQFAGWRPRWVARKHDQSEDTDGVVSSDVWHVRGLPSPSSSSSSSPSQSSFPGAAGCRVAARASRLRAPGSTDHPFGSRPGGPLHVAVLDETWVNGMLEPTVEAFLEDFEPRHVAGVLWALATLGIRPRPELLHALCERAADCARQSATIDTTAARGDGGRHRALTNCPKRMTAQGLSLTLWALARLGFQPSQPILEALLTACEADMRVVVATAAGAAAPSAAEAGRGPGALPTTAAAPLLPCCSLDLAQRAWALASLGRHPGGEWVELLIEAFLSLGPVEQVSGQTCSMMMWALARLQALNPATTPRPLRGGAEAGPVTGATSHPAARSDIEATRSAEGSTVTAAGSDEDCDDDSDAAAVREALRARAESGQGASTSGRNIDAVVSSAAAAVAVAKTAAAATKTSVAGHPAVADGKATGPEADLEAWVLIGGALGEAGGGRSVSSALVGMSAACASPWGVLRRPGRVVALLEMLQGALGRMTSQHLATVLWALSSLDVRPSEAWLEAFLAAAGRRLNARMDSQPFGPQSLAMMLGAMARLRYRPPSAWMARFLEVCRKELPSFGPHSACVLAWALVRLSYKPPGDWRRAFALRTQRLLPAMPPLGLCLLLWSLASWRSRPPLPWIHAAFAVSAGHMRAGVEAWSRSALALEAQSSAAVIGNELYAARTAEGTRTEVPSPLTTPPGTLRPELLAIMLWSMAHLITRPPPASWLSLADSATQAAMRYSGAVAFVPSSASSTASPVAAAVTGGTVTSGGGPDAGRAAGVLPEGSWPKRRAAEETLGPRTLAMLLQGWARLGRPPADGFLAATMLYITNAAAAAVAGGIDTNGIHRQGQDGGSAGPVLAGAVRRADTVGSQHVVIVLWSCAMMGFEPPAGLVDRLVTLHADLLLLRTQERGTTRSCTTTTAADDTCLPSTAARNGGGSQAQLQDRCTGTMGAGVEGEERTTEGSMEAVAREDGGQAETSDAVDDLEDAQQLHRRHFVVAQELLARQPELGMLVWALLRFRIVTPPQWLPAVLASVGCILEQDAAAAVAAITGGVLGGGGGGGGGGAAAAADRGLEAASVATPRAVSSEVGMVGKAVPSARTIPPPQPAPQHKQQDFASPAAPVPTSSITLITVKTLANACLVWRVHPGDRWIEAASACLDACILGTKLQRTYGRANLESEVRYLLEQLQSADDSAGGNSNRAGSTRDAAGSCQQDSVAAAWATAAEATGDGVVLTNAMAAVAAGSAAAWMQSLLW